MIGDLRFDRFAEKMGFFFLNGLLNCRGNHTRVPPPHFGAGVAQQHFNRDLIRPRDRSHRCGRLVKVPELAVIQNLGCGLDLSELLDERILLRPDPLLAVMGGDGQSSARPHPPPDQPGFSPRGGAVIMPCQPCGVLFLSLFRVSGEVLGRAAWQCNGTNARGLMKPRSNFSGARHGIDSGIRHRNQCWPSQRIRIVSCNRNL